MMKFFKKLSFLLLITFLFGLSTYAQKIDRVEPMFWWNDMKNTSLQLLIYGDNISMLTPEVSEKSVKITKVHKAKSPNYLFIDLDLSEAKSGFFNIDFLLNSKKVTSYRYELKERIENSSERVGFNSSDVVYLITPDRFSNSNPENDQVKGLLEQEVNRKDDYKRHGGDIKGITNHLDYIDDLGFTAIWSCPVLTNDMKSQSYHGYAITDLYQVDPRFGTLDDYIELSEKASEKGIKLIMDQVANHCGLEHWWMKDLPFDDWVNFQSEFEKGEPTTYSNHRRTTNQDKYASQSDKMGLSDGWFVDAMPDLNQRNPFMANYIIQNSIWWIEVANLGGIRQDTYPYPDKKFMANWAGAIMNEYPNFSIVGEEWSYNPLLIAYWQEGTENHDGYKSNLTSSMDFAMQKLVIDGIKEEEKWDTGLVKIYEGLANDFAYAHPEKIMIFPDNHDMSRIHTQMNLDLTMTKMALSYYLVMPRIPQLYYGTEILMHDTAKPGDHGLIRTDFPGGWEGDSVNGFSGEGLTSDQKEMQLYLKTILNFRKGSKAIHNGKTTHFAPKDGVYVLFRISDNEIVVHILNKNDESINMDLTRFDEIGLNGKQLRNIQSKEIVNWEETLLLNTKGATILTTKL